MDIKISNGSFTMTSSHVPGNAIATADSTYFYPLLQQQKFGQNLRLFSWFFNIFSGNSSIEKKAVVL